MPPSAQPRPVTNTLITFPDPHILLVTLANPTKMNTLTYAQHHQLAQLWDWYDAHPTLRCAVITGAGTKAFCAGSNLLEIEEAQQAKREGREVGKGRYEHPASGFAGLSRRRGRKPVVAAVNGLALGGGFEIVLNCNLTGRANEGLGVSDITIASPKAEFGLPEALVGVYASGGGLPRLVHTVGMAAASDIALTGRRVSAQEAYELRVISRIAKTHESVLREAMEVAKQIAIVSPEGIIVTRAGLREAWEGGSVEEAFVAVHERLDPWLMKSENSKEGLAAFREKRKPRWKDAKL